MWEHVAQTVKAEIALAALLSMSWPTQGQQQIDPGTLDPSGKKQIDGVVGFFSWKPSAPGLMVELREVKRDKVGGKLMVGYELYLSGAPTDQPYALFSWPINESDPQLVKPEVYIGPDGSLRSSKDGEDRVIVGIFPAEGQPLRISLISQDTKVGVLAAVVPDPIIGTDQGCSVEAIRVTPKFEAAFIRGKGFKAGERVPYISNSAGEIFNGDVTVDAAGEIHVVILPFVKGKETGSDLVTFKASGCAPAVWYKWGSIEQ